MTNSNSSYNEQGGTIGRFAQVPAVGAARPGSFWQRWKEWERENGTFAAPVRDRVA